MTSTCSCRCHFWRSSTHSDLISSAIISAPASASPISQLISASISPYNSGTLSLKPNSSEMPLYQKFNRAISQPESFRKMGRGSAIRMGSSIEMDVLEEVKHKIKEPERNFAGTPYIPIYVMLPLGVINSENQVADPQQLAHDLRILKSLHVDGVMLDVWWGLVEKENPQNYDWAAYHSLFDIVRSAGLKLQVVMSFHQCGGNVGDDVNIPLPKWILDIGMENPDIFFTDKGGTRNSECLSWGVDKERVLKGRTGLEVYFDFMRSFRQTFDDFFEDGTIDEIEVGLGPCGELRYPSYPQNNGWVYPGIGEFQCYDKYMMQKLKKAAMARGHAAWGKAPANAGDYNSQPHETGFFRDGGDYDSYYGRFFLRWYSEVLIHHGDDVLSLAKLAFSGTRISAKVSGIHWWYKTASHAPELTAGFYNPAHRDGYGPIARMFAKHNATFNFTCVELRTMPFDRDCPEALSDPEGLVWQVLNAAWDAGIHVASENALPCYDRAGYNKILENAKPRKDPDGRHLSAFTYLRLAPELLETTNVLEFARFVDCLHDSQRLLRWGNRIRASRTSTIVSGLTLDFLSSRSFHGSSPGSPFRMVDRQIEHMLSHG